MIWLVIVVGAGAGIANYQLTKRLWAVVDTPRISTGHVVIGRVEVSGKAQPRLGLLLVTSPLSGRSCVWWQVEVEQEIGSGKHKSWDTRHKVTSAPWIEVDDGTGPVAVNIATVPTSVSTSTVRQQNLPPLLTSAHLTKCKNGSAGKELYATKNSASDEALNRTLVQRLVSEITKTFDPNWPIAQLGGTWRVTERYVELGSVVYVLGNTVYDSSANRAHFVSGNNQPLLVYVGAEKRLVGTMRLTSRIYACLFLCNPFWTGCAPWEYSTR